MFKNFFKMEDTCNEWDVSHKKHKKKSKESIKAKESIR